MTIIKSFYVGNGDTCYIDHGSDNFTIIDCHLIEEYKEKILKEIKEIKKGKGIFRFISTHPDEDHIKGLELIDDQIGIENFYVVENKANKKDASESFRKYCSLRDDVKKSYYLEQECKRKYLNKGDDKRGSSGINILWPLLDNSFFQDALQDCNEDGVYNNISPVIRYSLKNGANVLWIGDLESEYMKNIFPSIKAQLSETTIVFAPHHGRASGKIPNEWLDILNPKIIIIGSASSRYLNYYTGYDVITQNRAKDITMLLEDDKVHFYSSEENYGSSRKKPLKKDDQGKKIVI